MSEAMIAHLRRKIVLVSLVAVLASLAALVFAINYAHYLQTDASLRTAMDEIADDGQAERREKQGALNGADTSADTYATRQNAATDAGDVGGVQGRVGTETLEGEQMMRGGRKSARTQYGSRFFFVLVGSDGSMFVRAKGSSELSNEDALGLAQRVLDSDAREGYLDDYKYVVEDLSDVQDAGQHAGQGVAQSAGEGTGAQVVAMGSEVGGLDAQKRILLLDCTTELQSLHQLLSVSLAVAGCAFVVVALFVLRFSRLAVQPLEQSARKQKQFVADAGHELKTPLSVIATNMDILEADLADQPDEQEWIDSTNRQVENMRRLVGDLITLSKMEDKEVDLVLTEVSLSDVAHECLFTFAQLAKAQGKQLDASIDEDVRIKGDEPAIRQLMTILIDNAIKYATGETVWVELRSEARHAVFLTRNDWAHDVATQDLNSLFDRFVRGERSRDRSGGKGGYGLGLSIARAIAERSGVRLGVGEDNAGRIVFSADFPRR